MTEYGHAYYFHARCERYISLT